jgi:hypothetical protein
MMYAHQDRMLHVYDDHALHVYDDHALHADCDYAVSYSTFGRNVAFFLTNSRKIRGRYGYCSSCALYACNISLYTLHASFDVCSTTGTWCVQYIYVIHAQQRFGHTSSLLPLRRTLHALALRYVHVTVWRVLRVRLARIDPFCTYLGFLFNLHDCQILSIVCPPRGKI